MTLSNIPWPIVIFLITQAGALVGFGFWVYYSIKALQVKITEMEKENAEVKKELRELRETLLLVKHSVDLLVLGQLKTGQRKDHSV